MKKLILFLSLIMIICVISCSSNITLSSQIVGVWELQYVFEGNIQKSKYIFNRDNTFQSYDTWEDGEMKGSGNYSIDNIKSQITMNLIEFNGKPQNTSFITTFAISENKLVFGAMVGGDTETLIGEWSAYSSSDDDNSFEITYNFKPDGILTVTLIKKGTEEPIIEIMNANWKKDSDTTITISGSEYINGVYYYWIIGKGLILSLENKFDMYFYNRIG